MMSAKFSKLLVSSLVCLPFLAVQALTIDNQKDLYNFYGAPMYAPTPWLATTKVAILDQGFEGFDPKNLDLPESAELVKGPLLKTAPSNHGFGMAALSWAVLDQPVSGPKFYLVNANGFTNFKAAVDFVIKNNIDIVIYSNNWLYGSNFDGEGLFEPLIKKAVDNGAIWLTSAGNFHGLVYNRAVLPLNAKTGYVPMPSKYDQLNFRNRDDDNQVTITLAWNDFTGDDTYAATKDLDLFVYDRFGTEVGRSTKKQAGEAPPETGASDLSGLAREDIVLPKLRRGDYSIKVKASSENFVASDRLRIYVNPRNGGSVQLLEVFEQNEIAAPGDSESAITVGDCSEAGSQGLADSSKPDVVMPLTFAQLSTNEGTFATSNATALLGGIVALMKSTELNFTQATLKQYLKTLKPDAKAGGFLCETKPVWRTPSPSQLQKLMKSK